MDIKNDCKTSMTVLNKNPIFEILTLINVLNFDKVSKRKLY